MKTNLARALVLLFGGCLLVGTLPSAHAQQTDALQKQFLEYKTKAEKGDAEAQNNLGFCYAKGQGVAKDEVEGVKWYRKAADQGHALAQLNLGICYAFGEGVAKNHVEAVKWWRRASDQGEASAQNNLGICYLKGQGVAKDEVEAVKWFRKAADQGDAIAQFSLGFCYAEGQGVAKDEVEAYALFNIAAIKEPNAAQNREILERKISPDQRAAGQRRTKELQKVIEENLAKKAGK